MTVTDAPVAAGRRVTPTGRLVLPSTASREQWLAARRAGIGSSDIPKVLNVTTYGTPSHIYYEKIGELPEDDRAGEAALWGQLHEATVADEWARRNRSAIRRVGLVAQDGAPWRMCTLDRRVTVCPLAQHAVESCALEVKTRSAFLAGKWKRQIPDDVLAQVIWQIVVTGYDHIHGAVLIGGNDYRQFTVYRRDHEQLIADITTVADRLWHEHIVRRVPPPATGDPDALIELFDELNPDRSGIAHLDRDLVAYEALQEYLESGLVEGGAKERKQGAKAVMVNALGDAEIGVIGDEIVCTYQEVSRESVDTALLAERWPEAYDACVTRTVSRRFDIPRKFRSKWRSSE